MKRDSRIINLKSVHNLRTLAGLPAADGRKIRENVLLRSAALHKMSPKDAQILHNVYGLKTVVDLRTESEMTDKPDRVPSEINYLYLPVSRKAIPGVSREAEPGKDIKPEMLPELTVMYRSVVADPECIRSFGEILRQIVTHRGGSILWHCTAGKDRCGLTSVFVEYMLGVDYDSIMQDYLLTNLDSMKTGNKYYFLIRYLKRDSELAAKVRSMYAAEREYLEAAFSEIQEKFGGMDRYIREQLNISDDMINCFREYALK